MNILVSEYESMMVLFYVDKSQASLTKCDSLDGSKLAQKDFPQPNLGTCQSRSGALLTNVRFKIDTDIILPIDLVAGVPLRIYLLLQT